MNATANGRTDKQKERQTPLLIRAEQRHAEMLYCWKKYITRAILYP